MASPGSDLEHAARQSAPVARSVAIIMDGNGRWAEQRGLPGRRGPSRGHEVRCGGRSRRRSTSASSRSRVYAFSTENWTRPTDEVEELMEIFGETIERELPDLAKQGVRMRFVGRRDRAPESLRRQMEALEADTVENDRLRLWIAFDYGGRAELVEAARRLVASGVDARDVDDERLAVANLDAPEMPDPDLLIRTSGEVRISNFLLWQLAYAELVFVGHPLARLRRRRARARARGVRGPPPPVRRPMSRSLSGASSSPSRCRSRSSAAATSAAGGSSASRRSRRSSALHELFRRSAAARPLVLAGYAGAVVGLLGAELGGTEWLLGGLLVDVVFAFVLYGVAETRQSATVAIASTIFGAFWIGVRARRTSMLLRDIGDDTSEGSRSSRCCWRCWRGDTAAYFAGRLFGRHKLAPMMSPGKTWEGFVVGRSRRPCSSSSSRSTRIGTVPRDLGDRSCSAP